MVHLGINADVLQLSCERYLSSPERAKKNDNAEYNAFTNLICIIRQVWHLFLFYVVTIIFFFLSFLLESEIDRASYGVHNGETLKCL